MEKAPEKLYILFNRPYTVDYAKLNKRRCEEEVEYVRKDSFIEKTVIDSLEIKEVDLDSEIRRYRMRNPIIQHREESLYDYMANVAKYFFELGLKAKDK